MSSSELEFYIAQLDRNAVQNWPGVQRPPFQFTVNHQPEPCRCGKATLSPPSHYHLAWVSPLCSQGLMQSVRGLVKEMCAVIERAGWQVIWCPARGGTHYILWAEPVREDTGHSLASLQVIIQTSLPPHPKSCLKTVRKVGALSLISPGALW